MSIHFLSLSNLRFQGDPISLHCLE
jgi:hypothetical protein